MKLNFETWFNFHEASRKSLVRSMGKYIHGKFDRPVATLTAFRGDLTNPKTGEPLDDSEALKQNLNANRQLEKKLSQKGLSYYPVKGIGEEEDPNGGIKSVVELSYVVSPRNKSMKEKEFENHIRELLFSSWNPRHRQWGALIKFTNHGESFMLHVPDGGAKSPDDYIMSAMGDGARLRTTQPFYTQMSRGPMNRSYTVGA